MQFRMLCQQSIDNVTRKRAYHLLNGHYRELTQLAFSDRLKDFAQQNNVKNTSGNQPDGTAGFEAWLRGSKRLFEDDFDAIKSLVLPSHGASQGKLVGIEKIQKSIDILTERLDFTVQNSIPIPVALSETLRNSVIRRKDFVVNDYDKAVIDKILLVLVNSEGLQSKRFGPETVLEEADEEEKDMNMQKEQTAEEEVLKEQVRI